MTMPATYGDVTAEYVAARDGAGLVAGGAELVWVRGGDAVTFLDGLLSQSVAALPIGAGARSLLLSPQGKLRSPLWVLRGDDEVALITDAGYGRQTMEDLSRFKIRVDVDIADGGALVEMWGSGTAGPLAGAGLPVPEPSTWTGSDGDMVARLNLGRTGADRFVVDRGRTEDLIDAGAVPVGFLAATAVRIEAGLPVMGIDIDEATIPQEADLVEGAVDFDKGCYLGQELVARIDSRGRVTRRLRGLLIRDPVIPPVGAAVVGFERDLGRVTSVGESYQLRAPVALATVRHEAAPGASVELVWEGGTAGAEVRELPLDPELGGG